MEIDENWCFITKESKDSEVEIDQLSAIFGKLLQFVYTGEVKKEDLNGNCHDLILAADYYQIKDLKNICEQNLISKLTVANAVDSLVFAEKANSKKLKEKAIIMVLNNKEAIKDGQAWKQLKANDVKLPSLDLSEYL